MIYWEGGSYEPTKEDRVWLLRAVTGEGPDADEVAQTLVNRFAYLQARGVKAYPTIASLVRAYSQPVNPRWVPGGDKYEASTDPNKSRRVARRQRIQALTHFTDGVEGAVDRALGPYGGTDIPPNAVDFSAPGSQRAIHKPLTPAHAGRNQLFTTDQAEDWTGYGGNTTTQNHTGAPPTRVALALALGAAVVALVKGWDR